MRTTTKTLACLAVALLLALPAVAQTGSMAGTVIDEESGEPLPGANVRVQGENLGAAAAVDGTYEIDNIPEGTYNVVASFIGYRSVTRQIEIEAGEEVIENFSLLPDYTGLEEVVVTGIASSRSKLRSEVAVAAVNAEELTEAQTYQDVSQLLTGKAAGVNIQPSSGNVGGGIRFNIRGASSLNSSQPVIYIDGVRVDNSEVEGYGAGGQGFSTLADLNPEEIASVEVLKGPASAAIYGTEGANGVVLITTKRGSLSSGGNLDVNYKGTFGYSEQQTDYDPDVFVSADAANDIFQRGDYQQHTISASGGSEYVSFFTSFSHRNNQGIIENNSGEFNNMRANFEAYPTEQVTLRASAAYTVSELVRPDNDNNIFGQLGNVLLAPFGNPYYFTDSLSVYAIDDQHRIQRFLGSLSASYRPVENLSLNMTAGYDGSSRRQDKTYPQNMSYSGVTSGERDIYNRIVNQFNAQFDAQYAYAPTRDLQMTTILGSQFNSRRVETFFGVAQNFPTELIRDIAAGSDIQELGQGFTNVRSGGLFAQQDFAFQDRYYVTAQLRRDFATQLGENVNVAAIWYPGIRGAVRLDQFGFVPSAFGLLKLRLAYGETGNLPGLLDSQPSRYDATPSGYGAGATLFSVGDAAIEPERVREIEGGVDLELYNRYSLEATLFKTWASNSIIDFDPAPSTGFGLNTVPRNVGGIESQGFELALGITPFRTRNNQVDLNVTYTYSDNEVTDLGGSPPIFSGFDINVVEEGLPKSVFYTYEVAGAQFNEDGTVAFTPSGYAAVELANDGERVAFGTPYPQHYGGVNLNIRLFRNLNIRALADYAFGLDVFNSTESFAVQFLNSQREQNALARLGLAEVEGIEAFEPGTPGYIEAANDLAKLNPNYDGNFVEDADYVKLREIAVRYDFSGVLGNLGINQVRSLSLGVAARNIATWTEYSGPDPEVNFDGNAGGETDLGQDFLTLQNPRQLYFTVSLGL